MKKRNKQKREEQTKQAIQENRKTWERHEPESDLQNHNVFVLYDLILILLFIEYNS